MCIISLHFGNGCEQKSVTYIRHIHKTEHFGNRWLLPVGVTHHNETRMMTHTTVRIR